MGYFIINDAEIKKLRKQLSSIKRINGMEIVNVK